MKIHRRQNLNTNSDITLLTIRSQELRPKLDPLMPVQRATPQNVIHHLIITPVTTQRLSNNIYSTQVGPNSGVIRNQAENHRDHRTIRHHAQKPGRELVSWKYSKGIPAHISPIPSTLPIHQQVRVHLRAQVKLRCATPIQIPTLLSRFLRDAIDHFFAIYTNMSRNPHQSNHKLIRSQPPQSFLTLVDDRMSPW
jgi:hypothetical protein